MLHELRQRANGRLSQRLDAFGDVIRDLVQRGVLVLKEVVQVIELRHDDVPVVIVRLGVEHVLIGQQRRQQPDDTLPLSVGETGMGGIVPGLLS